MPALLNIDHDQLRKLAAMQCTFEEIAAWFNCSRSTLYAREDLRKIIEQERLKAHATMRRNMFQSALDGDRQMMIWLSKQYLGMREKTEHSGEGLRPLTIEFAEAQPPKDADEG
tara:strand:+ start:1766 stop:2107 length:342 start_codon:yes stop_codon:yes gene_type:complete